jgi:hypothetical protein
MIKLTAEEHEQFVKDPEFANKVLLDVGARSITEFWRQLIPIIRAVVGEAYEQASVLKDFELRHPEVKEMGVGFGEHIISARAENPNSAMSETLERAWELANTKKDAG